MELLAGFYTIFTTPETLMFVVLGAVLGVIVGAVPGLTASAAIAMLVPITYYIDPLSALAFLYVIGKAGRFGGSISAILFNTPGTTAAAATVIDGHALTKKGKGGKGAIEGVAAPEAANNAVSGPSMIPLLALGVPGSTIAAMLMGVFLIHGIQVGPKIFETSGDIIYGLFAVGLIGIVLYGLIGWFLGPLIGRVIAKVPPRLIYPTILAVALISAYAARSSMFDVLIACIFGIIGYFMRTLNFSPAAAIIAFVLAPGAEQALRQSVLLTDAGFGIFLQRPVALAFFAIPLIAIGIRVVSRLRAGKSRQPAQEAKHVT